jgi:hypothetical protein
MVKAGELGNSCMSRHPHTQKFLEFYAKNENVKLFLKTNEENKTIARALLWKTDKGLYLDRRYAIDNDIKMAMLKEAQNRFKLHDFFKEKLDHNIDLQIEVPFINAKNASKFEYPYMDTFKYLVIYNNKSILYSHVNDPRSEFKDAFDIYTLERADGGFRYYKGYDENDYDKDGYDKDGYDKDGYDRDGYDRDGYDKNGYDKDGYDKDGYDKDGYDKDGFDQYGYGRDGYNKKGYDIKGYDRDGYSKYGYKIKSYDRDGYNKSIWL